MTTKHYQYESIHVIFSGESSHDQEPLVQTFRVCDERTLQVRFADCGTRGGNEPADPRVSGQADRQGGVQGEEVCLHVQGDDSGKDQKPGSGLMFRTPEILLQRNRQCLTLQALLINGRSVVWAVDPGVRAQAEGSGERG